MANIEATLKEIKKSIPDYVTLVAAAKGRTAEELKEAIDAGIEIIDASIRFICSGKAA